MARVLTYQTKKIPPLKRILEPVLRAPIAKTGIICYKPDMSPRLAVAAKLIETTGMGRTQAMRTAGYAHLTTRKSMNSQPAGTRAALQSAQDKYLVKFMKRANVESLDPITVAKTLGNVIRNGDMDQQINAINSHFKVILRRSDSMISHSRHVGNITVNQNYIIPQRDAKWKDSAIESENISLSPVKVLPATNQKVSLSPVKFLERAGRMTEKSKRLKDLNDANRVRRLATGKPIRVWHERKGCRLHARCRALPINRK